MRTPPRFLADAMLERLARWLRVLGIDTVSAGSLPDDALVRRAVAEGRVLLTRDRRLVESAPPGRAELVGRGPPLEQLRVVLARFGLRRPDALFTRCLLCNEPLRPASAAALRRVRESDRYWIEPVRECPRCERVYWEGAHTRRMRRALDAALDTALDADAGGAGHG